MTKETIVTRKQLLEMYPNLTRGDFEKKHDILMDHLQDYMDIEVITNPNNGRKTYKITGEIPAAADVPKCPRKRAVIAAEKKRTYEEYVKNHLPHEFEPETKARMSRNAMRTFGERTYSHKSVAAVTRRFVGPAMEKYGIKSGNKVWVDKNSYRRLSAEEVSALKRKFYDAFELNERKLFTFWYDTKSGDAPIIPEEDKKFMDVLDEFITEYQVWPIIVDEWKLKEIEAAAGS